MGPENKDVSAAGYSSSSLRPQGTKTAAALFLREIPGTSHITTDSKEKEGYNMSGARAK